MGVLFAAAPSVWACGTSENEHTGNLVSFVGSPCKKEAPADAGTGIIEQALLTAVDGAALAGLQCVAWERAGTDGLKIDLVNFEGACGAQWRGSASVSADGSLALRLDNPQCLIASCGWCIYDWSFEVRGVGAASPLPVGISIDTCPGAQPLRTYQLELPVAGSPEGVLCRYANYSALGWQAQPTGTCGTLDLPCEGTSMCSSTTERSCDTGLVCDTNGTAEQYICLAPCAVDADCPSASVLACQAGFCRPADNW